MKILLAPSEQKKEGGEAPFKIENLFLKTLSPMRTKLLHQYINLIQQGDIPTLSKLFGLKKEQDILKYQVDIIHELTLKAIKRYQGVAFDYLSYHTLKPQEQHYIDSHVILFSNLFGPIKASDHIPNYKLKQGEMIQTIKPEKFYHTHSKELLEAYFQKEEILDLRAGFYHKFYTPSKPYTTLKFLKNGKVVSHWAKAYRGIILREIAIANIKNLNALETLDIQNLIFKEKKIFKNKTEIIYEIEEKI